jgi:hypothetical protein
VRPHRPADQRPGQSVAGGAAGPFGTSGAALCGATGGARQAGGNGGRARSEAARSRSRGGFAGAGASPFGRGGARRLVGVGDVGSARSVGRAGPERGAAGGGDRESHRPYGGAGFGAGHLAVAVPDQCLGRVAGRGFRGVVRDAAVSRLGSADPSPRDDRNPALRAGARSVRAGRDDHTVRFDQHLFRRRGGGAAQSAATARW